MPKRLSFGSHFEKLNSLRRDRTSDEHKRLEIARAEPVATLPLSSPVSANVEESGSLLHTVPFEQSPRLTESATDTLQKEPDNTVTDVPDPNQTGSEMDKVQVEPPKKRTGAKLNPLPGAHAEGFTKVGHSVLRGECQFSDPIDFMIYLHLYSYSVGFGRDWANMGQSQLERFTGAARNTVKRSLDRLVSKGWIKCIEEYECARMSRKWRVVTPEERGRPNSNRHKPPTGSSADPVQGEQDSKLTPQGSNSDSVTGSKMDLYKERDLKENSKNSLSRAREQELLPKELQDYFRTIQTERKRVSELAALRELEATFVLDEIGLCVQWLIEKGTPLGEPCHSPLRFLTQAMPQVLTTAKAEISNRAEQRAMVIAEQIRGEQELLHEKQKDAEFRAREEAFQNAFPSIEDQNEWIQKAAVRFPYLDPQGPAVRAMAIADWHPRPNQR